MLEKYDIINSCSNYFLIIFSATNITHSIFLCHYKIRWKKVKSKVLSPKLKNTTSMWVPQALYDESMLFIFCINYTQSFKICTHRIFAKGYFGLMVCHLAHLFKCAILFWCLIENQWILDLHLSLLMMFWLWLNIKIEINKVRKWEEFDFCIKK